MGFGSSSDTSLVPSSQILPRIRRFEMHVACLKRLGFMPSSSGGYKATINEIVARARRHELPICSPEAALYLADQDLYCSLRFENLELISALDPETRQRTVVSFTKGAGRVWTDDGRLVFAGSKLVFLFVREI